MLAPQRAASKRFDDDPEKVASFEPEAATAANWFRAVIGAGMTALCVWLVFKDNVGISSRWVMAFGAIFFAYVTVNIARRANTQRPASFDAKGLWFDGPTSRKLIAWDNIERLSQLSRSSPKLIIIALKDAHRVVEQYDEAEANLRLGKRTLWRRSEPRSVLDRTAPPTWRPCSLLGADNTAVRFG